MVTMGLYWENGKYNGNCYNDPDPEGEHYQAILVAIRQPGCFC